MTRTPPWDAPPAPECEFCENTIHNGDDHDTGCEQGGMNAQEILHRREEDAKIAKAEMKMEEQRLQEAMNNS